MLKLDEVYFEHYARSSSITITFDRESYIDNVKTYENAKELLLEQL